MWIGEKKWKIKPSFQLLVFFRICGTHNSRLHTYLSKENFKFCFKRCSVISKNANLVSKETGKDFLNFLFFIETNPFQAPPRLSRNMTSNKEILRVDLQFFWGVLVKIKVNGKIRKAVLTAAHVVASKVYNTTCKYVYIYIPIPENYKLFKNRRRNPNNGKILMQTNCFKRIKIPYYSKKTKIQNIFVRRGYLESFSGQFGDDIGIILLPDDVFKDIGN